MASSITKPHRAKMQTVKRNWKREGREQQPEDNFWVFVVVRLYPIFNNVSFLSAVALVSVTLSDSNPRPSAEKRSNLVPTTTINFPNVKNDAGKNNIVRVF